MKGVILAGGFGTRLSPITDVTNKHLLPVYNKPMIFYPLQTLLDIGIKDILIVSGPEHTGHFISLLGSGKRFGASLSFKVQEEPQGIAHALSLAEDFSHGMPVTVILGDNIYEKAPLKEILSFDGGAMIFIKKVNHPNRFGVPVLKGDRIIAIEEKPPRPRSNYAVTGLYVYDSSVFNIIRTLKPSQRGELEITDVNNDFIKKGKLIAKVVSGFWSDAGTFESILFAGNFIRSKVH